MSDKLKKADKRLDCSQCNYQLTPEIYATSKSGEVKCPRCNSSIVIDSTCATSCFTCQSNYKENHSSCTEKIVSIDITNNNQEKTCEISGANVEKNDHGLKDSNTSMLLKAWQILKKGLFQVK